MELARQLAATNNPDVLAVCCHDHLLVHWVFTCSSRRQLSRSTDRFRCYFGTTQRKFAASSMLPLPVYCATCG